MYWQAAPPPFWRWGGWLIFALILGCLLVAMAGRGPEGPMPRAVPLFAVSMQLGAVFLARYMWLVSGTPTHLAASPHWLEIQPRQGPRVRLRWEAVRVARHLGTGYKRTWILECPEGDMVIRVGLLGGRAWQELSAIIRTEVRRRGATVREDEAGAAAPPVDDLEEMDP
jgi:hypothetical protein